MRAVHSVSCGSPADGSVCPNWKCGAAVGVEVLGDPREPPRWYCLSGHSGYFTVAEPLERTHPRAIPPRRYTRYCSECGNPVEPPARKCAECRHHE